MSLKSESKFLRKKSGPYLWVHNTKSARVVNGKKTKRYNGSAVIFHFLLQLNLSN